MRLRALLLIGILFTTTSCATGMTRQERRECRRARASAAGRGIGIAVAAVVVLAVFVAAAASGSSLSGSSSRRSRRARRRGLDVCRDRQPRSANAQTMPTQERAPPTEAFDPPSRAELQNAVEQLQTPLRMCAPGARGTLILDVDIDGPIGAVSSYEMSGDPAPSMTVGCVSDALRELQFAPFEGTVQVRWAVPLS